MLEFYEINPIKQEIVHDEHTMHGNIGYLSAYLFVHIYSYVGHYFRLHDIKLNGKPDVNGVYTAKKEAIFQNIEIFVICMLVGFTIKHLIDMEQESFHIEGVHTYFLILNSTITFFTKAYIYFGQMMKVSGEITKNIYTLFQV